MAVNFEIPTETIQVGSGSFTVRGCNSEDVVFLTTTYFNDIVKMVEKFGRTNQGLMSRSQVSELVMAVARDFPSMTAEIISRCADAPEQIDKFRMLPFIKQIDALRAIAILSVDDGAEIKNWLGGLASLLETHGFQSGPLTKSLQTIIESAENRLRS